MWLLGRAAWVVSWLLVWAAGASSAAAQATVLPLTGPGARDRAPAVSPDGGSIAFVSDRDAGWQLWVWSETRVRRLTDGVDPASRPSWSSDGVTLWFEAGGQVYRIPADGSAPAEPVPIFDDPTFRPSPSPDGSRLLVDRSSAGDHDLWIVPTSGSGGDPGPARSLAAHPGYDADARWSPDGRRVAFHSDRGRDRYHTRVWIVEADGSGSARPVTPVDEVAGYPAWSPEGNCVVHTRERAGDRDLVVVHLPSGLSYRLTSGPAFDADPVWAPDGRSVVFATDRWGDVRLARVMLDRELLNACG